MPEKRRRFQLWVVTVLVLNWLSIAFLTITPNEVAVVGYILGCLFAHGTLAAAWTAFGDVPFRWRFPLSIAWLAMLPVALGINMFMEGSGQIEIIVIMGGCLLGQWILLQIPFWTLKLFYELRLRHVDQINQEIGVERIQFGIRELFVVMTVVAVALGIGRIIVPHLDFGGEAAAFIFLVVAASILTVPLLLATLLRRLALPGVLLALVLTGVATSMELQISEIANISGPRFEHFIAINIASACLTLVIAGIVRLHGYRLCGRSSSGKP